MPSETPRPLRRRAVAAALLAVLGLSPAGWAASQPPEPAAQLWQWLPESERKELRARELEIKALPEGEREVLRQRLADFQSLSPGDRALVERRFQALQALPPEQRDAILRRFAKFNGFEPFGLRSFVLSVQHELDAEPEGRQRFLDLMELWQRKHARPRSSTPADAPARP